MSRPLPVFFSARARREAVQARDRWLEHRDKAPRAFEEDLDEALELVAGQPSVGTRAANEKLEGVRRLLLGRARYYLYYRVRDDPERVEVLSLWHAARGSGPKV